MKWNNFGVVGAMILLAGCYGRPTPQQVASADYGPVPTNYEQIVRQYYEKTLKDPYSAIFKQISYPTQGYLGTRLSGVEYGYKVCVTVNAKNSFGAYTGEKTAAFIIRYGKIAFTMDDISIIMPTACG